MPSTTMILLVTLVAPTLAQVRLPQSAVRGGAFSPAYSPAQMPHIEVAKKYGLPGQGSPAVVPDSRSVASSVQTSVAAGGMSPSQLAFLERQNAARGLAPTQQYQPPVFTQPSYSSPSYSSSAPRGRMRGYLPAYAPAYAPSFSGEPPALELDDTTQTSPNVVNIFAAALMGALVGVSGVTFVMRFRRSASVAFKEPLMTVSN